MIALSFWGSAVNWPMVAFTSSHPTRGEVGAVAARFVVARGEGTSGVLQRTFLAVAAASNAAVLKSAGMPAERIRQCNDEEGTSCLF